MGYVTFPTHLMKTSLHQNSSSLRQTLPNRRTTCLHWFRIRVTNFDECLLFRTAFWSIIFYGPLTAFLEFGFGSEKNQGFSRRFSVDSQSRCIIRFPEINGKWFLNSVRVINMAAISKARFLYVEEDRFAYCIINVLLANGVFIMFVK